MKLSLTKFQWGVLLGNLCDHYDTALYALLAPFIAHQFFPADNHLTSLIIAYALLISSVITRPLGSFFFGIIGDLRGGRKAFIISLVGVAVTTTGIAFLPTYNHIGYWAPVLLTLSRMLQSFFAVGELSSSGVLLMANTSPGYKNLISGFYNASTMGGILLASFAVMILSMYGNPEEGWRLLYLLGSLTIVFVIFLRKDGPSATAQHPLQKPKILFKMLWQYKRELSAIAVVYGFSYVCYSIAFSLVSAILPYITTLSKVDAVKTNTFFMLLDFALLPLFAWIGNFIPYRTTLLVGTILTIVFGMPLFACLQGADLQQALIVRFIIMVIGVSFASTILPWSQKLLPEPIRFTGTSVAFSLGSQIIGIPTTAISLWIYQQTGVAASTSAYWVATACISFGLVLWTKSRVPEEQLLSPH